jgi:hypothetical protein
MSKIELRLSNVDPPATEPKRTIYRDIVSLPDPVKLGLTIRYFNYDADGLYFQITGSGTGYTFGTVNLGLLASGANAYINLDEFASRAKPSSSDLTLGEKEENITLILKAYTDSGYTNLKWTFERVVTVHWINSADPAWTVDVLNNFDDATVQGWLALEEVTGFAVSLVAATDYVLSAPNSLKFSQDISGLEESRVRLYKSFTTPNKSKVFAVINFRATDITDYTFLKNFQVKWNGNVLIFLGRPYDTTLSRYYPKDKWMRVVVPLPSNQTLEIRLIFDSYNGSASVQPHRGWLDDFKLLSK